MSMEKNEDEIVEQLRSIDQTLEKIRLNTKNYLSTIATGVWLTLFVLWAGFSKANGWGFWAP